MSYADRVFVDMCKLPILYHFQAKNGMKKMWKL